MHSLVMIVGQNDEFPLEMFDTHEVLSPDEIEKDLVGDNARHGLDEITQQEIHRRMMVKLRLGERVVIDARKMEKNCRLPLATAGRSTGVPVIYLINGEVDRDTQRGDGIAEVFSNQIGDYRVVKTFSSSDIRERFTGITAIGDVHGMYQSFLNAISWARSRQHYIVLMGDVLDYGPDSLEVTDEVYRLVMRGEAAMILGNHERKIMRWIDGQRVRLSDGNRVTTKALESLGETNRVRWMGRFRGLFQHGSLIRQIENVTFAHAGVYSGIWKGEPMNRAAENMAYFGETDDTRSLPERRVPAYSWVDSIPAGKTAVVGHDRRAPYPFVETNEIGGTAVFLDTGSGKGGQLSSADFRFSNTGLRLENLNMH